MANRLLAQRSRLGAHALYVKSASDDSIFKSRRKKRKRGSGKFIPDVWEPPWGGAWARGAHGKPLSSRRATGAYRVRPWVGRGVASSEQAASKQEGKWLGAPWGAHGQGVRAAAPRPQGGRATACAPGWGGANIWEPPGGRTGRGAHGKPLSSRRANGAYRARPWVGRGKIAAGKAIVPPNYGGEGG